MTLSVPALWKKLGPLYFTTLAAIVTSFLLPMPRGGKIAGIPSPCAFFEFTGLPCPACGLTRSWVSCAHGQFAQALVWHPLGPLLFAIALIYLVAAPLGVKFSLPKWAQYGAVTVVVLVWALRLAGVFALPT